MRKLDDSPNDKTYGSESPKKRKQVAFYANVAGSGRGCVDSRRSIRLASNPTITPGAPTAFSLGNRKARARLSASSRRPHATPRLQRASLLVDDEINLALNQIAVGRQNPITHVIAARTKHGSAHVHVARRRLLRLRREHGAVVVLQIDR